MHNRRIGIAELTRILVSYGYLSDRVGPQRLDAETYRHFFIHPQKGLRLAVDLDYGVYGSTLTAAVTGLTLSLVSPEGLSTYTTNLGHDLGHTDIRTIIHTHLTAKETTA